MSLCTALPATEIHDRRWNIREFSHQVNIWMYLELVAKRGKSWKCIFSSSIESYERWRFERDLVKRENLSKLNPRGLRICDGSKIYNFLISIHLWVSDLYPLRTAIAIIRKIKGSGSGGNMSMAGIGLILVEYSFCGIYCCNLFFLFVQRNAWDGQDNGSRLYGEDEHGVVCVSGDSLRK